MPGTVVALFRSETTRTVEAMAACYWMGEDFDPGPAVEHHREAMRESGRKA